MKKSALKILIKTVQSEIKGLRQELANDADTQIKKAKKIVVDKLKNNTALSQPESELAISSVDNDEKKKMASNVTKTSGLFETEAGEFVGSGKEVSVKKEIKTKSGKIIPVSSKVVVKFKKGANSVGYIDIEGKPLRVPISIMYKYFSGCSKTPSMKTLEKANDAGICTTVFGSRVEPDGYDQYGAPSWMLVLGVI